MFAEIEISVIVWCCFALICGGFIKGALGVGTPLLTVPMMALALPPQTAIAIMAVPVVVANVWQFAQAERSLAVVERFWPTLIAILIGTGVGVKILSVIDDDSLLILVGSAVIAFAILQGSSYRLYLADSVVKPVGILFGGLAGVIGGVSSFFGPMLIVYLISIRGLSKVQFVNTISFLYVCAVMPWAITLYFFDILDRQTLIFSVIAVLPVTLGQWFGQSVRDYISEAKFKYLIVCTLVISGISMLWRASA
jgi:uncharacterized membrane protein YfcA